MPKNNNSKKDSSDDEKESGTDSKSESEEDKFKREYDTIEHRVNTIQKILKSKGVKPLTIIEKKNTKGITKNYIVHKDHDDEIDCNDITCILDKQIKNFHDFLFKFGNNLSYVKSGSTGHTFRLKGEDENKKSYSLAIKIVAFSKNEKYGGIHDIRRPENAELLMIHILSSFVTKKATSHIVLPLSTFNANIKTFVALTKDKYKEKKNYKKFLKKYEKGKFHNQISILISEWANGGDLLDYLRHKSKTLKLIEWKVIFFQLISVLAVIQLRFPGFRHNDLKANNVLVQEVPTREEQNWIQYHIQKQYYIVNNTGIVLKLWDFDFACIPNLVVNSKVDAKWTNDINVKSKKNQYYDLHFFFNTLRRYVSSLKKEKYTPKEVIEFIDRIVPNKYRKKKVLSENGRLLVDDEHTTPIKVIETDEFFEEFRMTEKEMKILGKKFKDNSNKKSSSESTNNKNEKSSSESNSNKNDNTSSSKSNSNSNKNYKKKKTKLKSNKVNSSKTRAISLS